jgi:hypothetical protein
MKMQWMLMMMLQLTDSAICDMVMKENKDNEDGATTEGKITIERMISFREELIREMEQRSFATEHHIMSL